MILLETITQNILETKVLTPATEATNQLWAELSEMFKAERENL